MDNESNWNDDPSNWNDDLSNWNDYLRSPFPDIVCKNCDKKMRDAPKIKNNNTLTYGGKIIDEYKDGPKQWFCTNNCLTNYQLVHIDPKIKNLAIRRQDLQNRLEILIDAMNEQNIPKELEAKAVQIEIKNELREKLENISNEDKKLREIYDIAGGRRKRRKPCKSKRKSKKHKTKRKSKPKRKRKRKTKRHHKKRTRKNERR